MVVSSCWNAYLHAGSLYLHVGSLHLHGGAFCLYAVTLCLHIVYMTLVIAAFFVVLYLKNPALLLSSGKQNKLNGTGVDTAGYALRILHHNSAICSF